MIGLIRLFLSVLAFSSSTCSHQPPETCRDTTKLCAQYRGYCYGNILEACRWTCGICPSSSYKGRCEYQYSGCHHLCDKRGDAVICSCLDGYRLGPDGKTCTDINECGVLFNPCSRTNKPNCINTSGSYFCSENRRCSLMSGYFNYYKSGKCCKLKLGNCGQSIPTLGRIVGGTEAGAGTWPWMCRLTYKDSVICGGALISLNFILTAGHCLRYKPSGYKIVFGDTKSGDSGAQQAMFTQTRNIKQIIFHEEFRFPNHDIAIVRMNSLVPPTEFVKPVCLPNGEVPKTGWRCWTTGYGNTDYISPRPKILMEVDLIIIPKEECSRRYGYLINENTICAGYKKGGKDSCYGDSGGPLVCQRCNSCQWYVAGITSFGRGCAEPGLYGVYTDVAAHEKWIRYHTGAKTIGCGGDQDATWSWWSPFTPCNASCGQEGFKIRYQECRSPDGKLTCAKKETESQKCLGTCRQWSIWGPWADCTSSCGGGVQVRNRNCVGELKDEPVCEGDPFESRDCNVHACGATGIIPSHACYGAKLDLVPICDSVIDLCDKFQAFMEISCQMTCCLNSLVTGSKGLCTDNLESKVLCEKHKKECQNPLYGNYFKENCKSTCGFC